MSAITTSRAVAHRFIGQLHGRALPSAAAKTSRLAIALCVLLLGNLETASAATPPHIVRTDLETLIRAAAASPSQFAVSIPYSVSTSTAGTWSSEGGRATWHYAVRVPTAVSLSRFGIPRYGVLSVS